MLANIAATCETELSHFRLALHLRHTKQLGTVSNDAVLFTCMHVLTP